MKTRIRKTTAWIMVVCMIVGFIPVFGSAAAAKDKPIQSLAFTVGQTDLSANAAVRANEAASADDPSAPQPEDGLDGLRSDSLFELLVNAFKSIIKNIQSLSVNEILNLPANAMDDVVTYIFAIIKGLGINMDSLYQKLGSIFFK